MILYVWVCSGVFMCIYENIWMPELVFVYVYVCLTLCDSVAQFVSLRVYVYIRVLVIFMCVGVYVCAFW